MIRLFFFLLFLFSFSLSKELEVCYKGYYIIVPVVKNCIWYKDNVTAAYAYSTPLGSLFKKVKYYGYSIHKGLSPKNFYFVQNEGVHRYIHDYKFQKRKIYFKKMHFKIKNGKEVLKKKIEKAIQVKRRYFDPFLASDYLYEITKIYKKGVVPIFFDGKFYTVPFKVLKVSKFTLKGKTYNVRKVLLKPDIKTSGLLRPKGDWIIWIDETMHIPIKMQLSFTVGSFKLILDSIKREE